MTKREKVLAGILGGAGLLYLLSMTSKGQGVSDSVLNKIAALIADHEGDELNVYPDEAGIWTVGKGHKILTTDSARGQKLYPYGPIKTITQAESDAFFERDTATARNAVSNNVRRPISDNMRAALASLTFNIGGPAFAGSTLVKLLNAGNIAAAANQFLVWNKVTVDGRKIVSSGLSTRRERERALFLS